MEQKYIDRFWSKVAKTPEGHWLWTDSLTQGYGYFHVGGRKKRQAHVLAYELLSGPVPPGMELGHTCEFRHCVLHVRPVTHQQNVKEGKAGQKRSHCKVGHPLDGDNVVIKSTGRQLCRTCKRLRALRYYYQKRDQ